MGFTVRIETPFPPYFVDCYIQELHLAFEADGKPWHSRKKDALRDENLMKKYNLPVLHLTENELKTKKAMKKSIQKISEFIDEHGN